MECITIIHSKIHNNLALLHIIISFHESMDKCNTKMTTHSKTIKVQHRPHIENLQNSHTLFTPILYKIMQNLQREYASYILTIVSFSSHAAGSSSNTHMKTLAHTRFKVSEALTIHLGLFFQYIKIKYIGTPDTINITPTPTSHGLT